MKIVRAIDQTNYTLDLFANLLAGVLCYNFYRSAVIVVENNFAQTVTATVSCVRIRI